MTDLGENFSPYGINNRGVAGGILERESGAGSFALRAAHAANGRITPYTRDSSQAIAINNRHQALGGVDVNGVGGMAIFSLGSYAIIPSLPGYAYDTPASLNDAGVAVGHAYNADDLGNITSASGFVYQNGVTTPVSIIPGAIFNEITGINNHGDMIGVAGTPVEIEQCLYCDGYLFHDGTWTDLGTVAAGMYGGGGSLPVQVNNNQQVVGTVGYGTTSDTPFLWANGTMISIQPPGEQASHGMSINDAGQVVIATFFSETPTSYLHDHGTFTNLGQLAAFTSLGWTNVEATGINNAGQITGTAWAPGKVVHGFVLTPTP